MGDRSSMAIHCPDPETMAAIVDYYGEPQCDDYCAAGLPAFFWEETCSHEAEEIMRKAGRPGAIQWGSHYAYNGGVILFHRGEEATLACTVDEDLVVGINPETGKPLSADLDEAARFSRLYRALHAEETLRQLDQERSIALAGQTSDQD